MNMVPLSTDRSSSAYTKILNKCSTNGPRDYQTGVNSCNDLHSIDLSLEEGKMYWIDIFTYNWWWDNSVTFSVETPPLDN